MVSYNKWEIGNWCRKHACSQIYCTFFGLSIDLVGKILMSPPSCDYIKDSLIASMLVKCHRDLKCLGLLRVRHFLVKSMK